MIQWKSVGGKKVPEPVEGLDEEFDEANARVEKIKTKLKDYLEDVKKELKYQHITYATASSRYRFEIEVPLEICKRVPKEYTNTSNIKGKKRY